MRKLIILLTMTLLGISNNALAKQRVVNVYAWTGEIPFKLVKQFEKETGIKVNFSMYENNEIMYTKIKASKGIGYDIVMPSSYFVDRMRRQGMLQKLDRSKLSNYKNLNPKFLHPVYDPKSDYSIPYIWGITGIFINDKHYASKGVQKWSDLWEKRFHNQLMLLDDTREVFSMALISLGYSANERDPKHIEKAYEKLKQLLPNIKVFSTETVISIMIDEDANIGMSWNGDAYKGITENKDIRFVFPKDGFVIWVDTLAIPKDAKHKKEAYEFINFLLRASVAKEVALETNFPIANLAGKNLLPKNIRNNKTIYPDDAVLKRGQFQKDVGDQTLAIYEKYWEKLKMGG